MDPISLISGALTVGSLIKEAISLVRTIESSLSKVSRNKKRVQELLDHILRTLEELSSLYEDDDGALEKCTDLRRSLNLLKTDMYRIHERCQKFVPERDVGKRLSRVKAQVRAWHKRDDIEKDIAQLRENVMSCYAMFTAFTSARIENSSVRVEQALLVHGAETRVRLGRLEILVNRMLLDTDFGHSIVRDLDNRLSVGRCDGIENQYVALQIQRITESLQSLAVTRTFQAEDPDESHRLPCKIIIAPRMESRDVAYLVLRLLRQLQDQPDSFPIQDVTRNLQTILSATRQFSMERESLALNYWVIYLYKTLASGNPYAFLPFLVKALYTYAHDLDTMEQYGQALIASEKAISCARGLRETHADLDFRVLRGHTLLMYGRALYHNQRYEEAVDVMQECTSVFVSLLAELPETFTDNPELRAEANVWTRAEHETILISGLQSFFVLLRCLALLNHLALLDRPSEVYHVARMTFNILPRLSQVKLYSIGFLLVEGFQITFTCLASFYKRHSLLIEDTLSVFRDLAQAQPTFFSLYFLEALQLYFYIYIGIDANGMVVKRCPDGQNLLPLQMRDSEGFTNPSDQLKRLDRFKRAKSITHDAIYALYMRGNICSFSFNPFGVQSLVCALFMFRADEGVQVIQEISEEILSGALDDAFPIENFAHHTQILIAGIPAEWQMKLLVIVDGFVERCRSIASVQSKKKSKPGLVALRRVLETYAEILDVFPGRQEDALKAAEESMELYRKKERSKRTDSPSDTVKLHNDNMAQMLENLARRYHIAGRWPDVISTLQEVLALRRRAVNDCTCGDPHTNLIAIMSRLTGYLLRAGRYPEAEALRAERKVWCTRVPPDLYASPVYTIVFIVDEEGVAASKNGTRLSSLCCGDELLLTPAASTEEVNEPYSSSINLAPPSRGVVQKLDIERYSSGSSQCPDSSAISDVTVHAEGDGVFIRRRDLYFVMICLTVIIALKFSPVSIGVPQSFRFDVIA